VECPGLFSLLECRLLQIESGRYGEDCESSPGPGPAGSFRRPTGSIQGYAEEISDPNRYRPDHCPQCEAKHPLTGHGFYRRTLVDAAFDGVFRIRRYLSHRVNQTHRQQP
jgi:hypothetical protein